jgi:septal ring-binding cell division protein DamX
MRYIASDSDQLGEAQSAQTSAASPCRVQLDNYTPLLHVATTLTARSPAEPACNAAAFCTQQECTTRILSKQCLDNPTNAAITRAVLHCMDPLNWQDLTL